MAQPTVSVNVNDYQPPYEQIERLRQEGNNVWVLRHAGNVIGAGVPDQEYNGFFELTPWSDCHPRTPTYYASLEKLLNEDDGTMNPQAGPKYLQNSG